ncbi:MAG: ribonuclease catalytic domain-containing protein [Granulosicoccus sp.]
MTTKKTPSPHTQIKHVLDDLGIQCEYSVDAIAESKAWLVSPGIDDPELTDLTALPFVTIDNPDSRDLDQALHIQADDDGYLLHYALADAAYYVRPGSALFQEALSRGATFYTPLIAAPMLPVNLSEGLVSLNPGVDRRALIFELTIDTDGEVTRCSVLRGRIHSHAKLNYGGVQAWLNDEAECSEKWHASLRLLKSLGECLIKASERRGVIPFDRQETAIQTSKDASRFSIGARKRYRTEKYNEQLSLICNMQGAQLLLGLSGYSDALQAVYRVHEAPLKQKTAQLRKTLSDFAAKQTSPDIWQWQAGQSLADYVAQLPAGEQNKRRVRSVQRQIMQAQRASSFQPDAGEHHALKAASYARFSSPMREIVGIFTHKELLEAMMADTGIPDDSPVASQDDFAHGQVGDETDSESRNEADEALREAVISAANGSRRLQRQVDKRIELLALHDVFDEELNADVTVEHVGTIMGFRSDRLYISLDSMAIDIKIYQKDLQHQYSTRYAIDNISAVPDDDTCPQWLLGDAVRISLYAFDAERNRFVFHLFQ